MSRLDLVFNPRGMVPRVAHDAPCRQKSENEIGLLQPLGGSGVCCVESNRILRPTGGVEVCCVKSCLRCAATGRDVLLVRFHGEGRGVLRTLASTPEAHGVEDMRFNDGKVRPACFLCCRRTDVGKAASGA